MKRGAVSSPPYMQREKQTEGRGRSQSGTISQEE